MSGHSLSIGIAITEREKKKNSGPLVVNVFVRTTFRLACLIQVENNSTKNKTKMKGSWLTFVK